MQITKKSLDKGRYKMKFAVMEKYLQMNSSDIEKDSASLKEYASLFKDPTCFAYMFLKDDNGKRMELYDYQDAILNDKHRFIYFRAANQIGKSLSFNIKAVHNLVIDHGHAYNEAIISKSLPQALDQMRRIKGFLRQLGQVFDLKEAIGITESMSVITVDIKDDDGQIKYTNKLIVAPCTEGLLGYDLHEENLDEFEYWDIDTRHFYNQIGEPRTYHTKGRIFIMSNPNGNESFGAELERMNLPNGENKFHTYIFDFLDCPANTEKDLEYAKVGKSRQEIESTLLAIRSISSKNFFTPDEVTRSRSESIKELDMVGKQPFFFLDVGSKHDQSVLVGGYIEPDLEKKDVAGRAFLHIYVSIIHCYPVGYPLSRVVGTPTPKEDGWHYEKSVKEHLEEWKTGGIQPVFGVDVTGNSGISPLFETVGITPVDVNFSGPKKSGMYQRLKYFMEKGLLHRIKSDEFEYQFLHLEMKKSERKYLMIHHESEDDLDDVCDSIAGLVYIADQPESEPSMVIIER